MAYAINGTTLTLQPTEGQWIPKRAVGYDGNGHPVYPGVREFEMRWELMSASEFNQILGFYQAIQSTGSAVVSLPKFSNASYAYYSYSGCALSEPEAGAYFEEYVTDVLLLVSNIRA